MPLFTIKTHEDVQGLYLVEASDAAAAEAMMGGDTPSIDWEMVTQIDYMAYSLAVESVTEVTLDKPREI
jgi:hypothetical protein